MTSSKKIGKLGDVGTMLIRIVPAILLVLFILRDSAGFSVPRIIFLVGIVAPACLMRYRDLCAYIFFISPLLCGIPSNYILPLLCGLWLIKRGTISKSALALFLFVAAWELGHIPFFDVECDMPGEIGYLSTFFLVVAVLSDDDMLDVAHCVEYFVVGTNVLFVCMIVNFFTLIGPEMLLSGSCRLGDLVEMEGVEEGMRLSMNANSVALFSVASLFSILSVGDHKKINPFLKWPSLFFSIVAGLLSMSRTWILVVALYFLLYFCLGSGSYIKKMVWIGVFAMFMGAILLFVPFFSEAIMGRFVSDDVTSGNGRTEIIMEYLQYLSDKPLAFILGVGVDQYVDKVGMDWSTHNMLQQIVVTTGLVGFLVLGFAFVYRFIKLFDKGRLFDVVPLFCVFVFYQTLQFLNPSMLMFPLMVVMCLMKKYKETEKARK